MKKWLVFAFLVLNISVLMAQGPAVPANTVIDSVKVKWGKVRIVDGDEMNSANDIVENIAASKECSTLASAIAGAGLTETFKSKGPITVFAPTNQAFDKLPAGKLDSLLKPDHKLDLNYLITYHAIAGRLTARDIEHKINTSNGEAVFTTLAGSKLTAKIDQNRNIVLVDESGNESIISKFDIPQSNGVLFIITGVLMPKPKAI